MMMYYVILYGDFKCYVVGNLFFQKMLYVDMGYIVKFIF